MESKTKSKLFSRLPCYKFSDEQNQWVEYRIKSSENFTPDKISLLTWNVLFDLFDKDQIHSELRMPIILSTLKELQPDIIGNT